MIREMGGIMQLYADRTEEEQEEPKTGAHADVWD